MGNAELWKSCSCTLKVVNICQVPPTLQARHSWSASKSRVAICMHEVEGEHVFTYVNGWCITWFFLLYDTALQASHCQSRAVTRPDKTKASYKHRQPWNNTYVVYIFLKLAYSTTLKRYSPCAARKTQVAFSTAPGDPRETQHETINRTEINICK